MAAIQILCKMISQTNQSITALLSLVEPYRDHQLGYVQPYISQLSHNDNDITRHICYAPRCYEWPKISSPIP